MKRLTRQTKQKKSWLDSLIEAISDGIDFVGDMMDKVGDVAKKFLPIISAGRGIWETIKPKWWPF